MGKYPKVNSCHIRFFPQSERRVKIINNEFSRQQKKSSATFNKILTLNLL